MILHSEEEQRAFGKRLAAFLQGGEILALTGDLGAGKTTLVQGVAQGLEIVNHVTSPTFTLMEYYEGRLPLCHIDAYRVEDPEELLAVGFDDVLDGRYVVAIEWPEQIQGILPDDYTEIRISRDVQGRQIEMTDHGVANFAESVKSLCC